MSLTIRFKATYMYYIIFSLKESNPLPMAVTVILLYLFLIVYIIGALHVDKLINWGNRSSLYKILIGAHLFVLERERYVDVSRDKSCAWPLCCLFFFDLRILITLLVSSNTSLGCKSKEIEKTNIFSLRCNS